ncbi:MAG: 3-dehydroquinate synthase [Bacteroidales bacterium]|nr:3-dehydroquinate synthase [Bacteroidales bacterium]
MEKIVITTSGTLSEIFVGKPWEVAAEMIPERGVAIITDENVYNIYGNRFPLFPVLKIVPGEESKRLKVIENLAEQLLDLEIDRSGFILAVGGGVVCDVAGFLASVYMRGIRCGLVSSSLLSQVDASTGGKNAVNLGEIKNVIGNFRQPEFVICDTAMLQTLPEQEYLSGLAELIKTGIIGDLSIFEIIEQNVTAINNRDSILLSDLVARSVRFKAKVVSKDEKENNLRRILNFGHTFGHAIEMHKSMKHGFAVAQGMLFATDFSLQKGFISSGVRERIINLLQRFKLLEEQYIPVNQVEQHIMHDKKRTGTDIHFIFIEGIGKPLIRTVPVSEVMDFYRQIKTGK